MMICTVAAPGDSVTGGRSCIGHKDVNGYLGDSLHCRSHNVAGGRTQPAHADV